MEFYYYCVMNAKALSILLLQLCKIIFRYYLVQRLSTVARIFMGYIKWHIFKCFNNCLWLPGEIYM